MDRARLFVVRRRFFRCCWVMGAATIVAAAGIASYALETNPPPDQIRTRPAVFVAPTPVVVDLARSGQQALRTILGTGCVQHEIAALALSQAPTGSINLVSTPSRWCQTRTFALTPGQGTVSAPASGATAAP
jgi:hypothetical protein